jgi:hypothetical protein
MSYSAGGSKTKVRPHRGYRVGQPPINGEKVKNQLLLSFLSERYPNQVVDTADWKRKPWIVARVVWTASMGRQDTTIQSASSGERHTPCVQSP